MQTFVTKIRSKKIWLPAENQYVCLVTVSCFALGSWVLEFWRLYYATFGTEEVVNDIQKLKDQIISISKQSCLNFIYFIII